MVLELTDSQNAFLGTVTEFANTVVAPRAAAIDESGAFPQDCLLYTSPSPRDPKTSRMPSSA